MTAPVIEVERLHDLRQTLAELDEAMARHRRLGLATSAVGGDAADAVEFGMLVMRRDLVLESIKAAG